VPQACRHLPRFLDRKRTGTHPDSQLSICINTGLCRPPPVDQQRGPASAGKCCIRLGHAGGTHGRQGCSRVRVGQLGHQAPRIHPRNLPVPATLAHSREIRLRQKQLQRRPSQPGPRAAILPPLVKRAAQGGRLHQGHWMGALAGRCQNGPVGAPSVSGKGRAGLQPTSGFPTPPRFKRRPARSAPHSGAQAVVKERRKAAAPLRPNAHRRLRKSQYGQPHMNPPTQLPSPTCKTSPAIRGAWARSDRE